MIENVEAGGTDVQTGEILAKKYRVDGQLGEGGMGVVLAATNVALNQKVAIKLLRAGVLDNQEALGRFLREARAAASLRSEHVARVLDVGNLEDGRPYMVMEHLSGCDLAAVIADERPVPVEQAVDYVLQVCEAIAEAHAAGIIHRDLKPKNLFLTQTVDGRPHVKVLDFGISKIEGPAEELQLTRTTEIIGSPSYMSPEQLRASRYVDARTDIWALGVILYELLTKGVPFHASTLTELVAVVLMDEPLPVRKFRPDVPDALAAAVMKCLEKAVSNRFSSVAELAMAIAPFGKGTQATFADRVQAVAAGSGRLPPIAMNSAATMSMESPVGERSGQSVSGVTATVHQSAPPPMTPRVPVPVMIAPQPPAHARTSMQWGQAGPSRPPPAASRKSAAPTIVLAAVLLLVAGGSAAGGAVWYSKRASAAVELPSGRKDLPPLTSAAAPPPETNLPTATAMPDSRAPVVAPNASVVQKPAAQPGTTTQTKPSKPAKPTNGAPTSGNNPLDDIGRN